MEVHQWRALARFQVADAEAVGVHVALGEGRTRCVRDEPLPDLRHDLPPSDGRVAAQALPVGRHTRRD